jgi:hypothetical protein
LLTDENGDFTSDPPTRRPLLLNLRTKTARVHRSNLMREFRIHSVSDLVLYAVRHNRVPVPKLEQNVVKSEGTSSQF